LLFDWKGISMTDTGIGEEGNKKLTAINGGLGDGLCEVSPDLIVVDLGIVDVDKRPLRAEVFDEGDSSRLACVASVSLECES
jgi:hypothetical protein